MLAALVAALLMVGAPWLARAQAPTPAPIATPGFTSAQADLGKAAYGQACARCHGGQLDDGEFGPPLRGRAFTDHWAGRPLSELYTLTRQQMPPGGAGTLTDGTYLQLIAYLLSQNGISAGTAALPPDLAALAALRFPGQAVAFEQRTAGPSGGLTAGASLPAWPTGASALDALTPVTDAMLQHPAEPDWLAWRRAFDDSGFSPLHEITRQNVGALRLAWSLALPPGPNEATPLVHDGVLFVHSYNDHVLALDAATGDELWHYARALPEGTAATVMRNIALWGDKVYLATSDCHEVALVARTGKVAWDHALCDPKLWRITGGPLVAHGRVMQGATGRSPGGDLIFGLDAQSGEERWRFHTIAQPGDPADSSWNGAPLEKRNGGSVWTAGSYDPELGLAFFGPAQTYDTAPLQYPIHKPGITNDGLYLDATVALDPDTGRLVWYFQHLPDDQWDYDWAFERQIIDLPVNGVLRKLVVTSGKLGIYDALEADTGKYVFSVDMGIQNLITAIDPKTGAKTIDPRRYPDKQALTVCPHAGGGRSWLPGSYNPATHVVYVASVESCMDLTPVAAGERGSLSSGFRWTLRPRPDSDGKYGRVQAVNLATRQTLWTARQRAPQSTGVLDTAGGVLFAGALDRAFTAYDDASGAVLWRTRLADVPSSAPISYQVHGKQYVAMVVGYGGAQSATFPVLVPEIKLPPTRSSSISVFELPSARAP
jgi:alcohol dehydrogenase (cytochrome c)